MRLDGFDDGASVRPDLDLSVFATGVAPALLVEANGSKICHRGVLSEGSLLLKSLGDVCWMPEFDFFHADRGEAEVISALRPGQVDDLFFGSLNVEKLLRALDVVNSHSVVIMKVNTGDVSAAWGKRDSRDTARAFLQLESADLFLIFGGPDVDGWRLTCLTSHDSLSVSGDVKRKDVVSVELRFV